MSGNPTPAPTPRTTKAPPAASSSGDDQGFVESDLIYIIITAICALLIVVIAAVLRARKLAQTTRAAREAVSEEFTARLRGLDEAIMQIVMDELSRGLPRVTPPTELVTGGVGAVLFPADAQLERELAEGVSAVGGDAPDDQEDVEGGGGGSRSRRKRRRGVAGPQSAGVTMLVTDAISRMHNKAAQALQGGALGTLGTIPGCPLTLTVPMAAEHLISNEAVLNFSKSAAEKTYLRIEAAIKEATDSVFAVPKPRNLPPEKITPEIAAQQDRDKRFAQERMPKAGCGYRLLCLFRIAETNFFHEYRRLFFYNVARMLAIGISRVDILEDKRRGVSGSNTDSPPRAATTSTATHTAVPMDAPDGVEMTPMMFNSSGYISRQWVGVFESCRDYVTILDRTGRADVKGHSRMLDLSGSLRALRRVFNPCDAVSGGGGGDVLRGHARSCSIPPHDSVVVAPLSGDVDLRYFSVGGLREDLHAFLKNLQLTLMRSDSTEKRHFSMFDAVTQFDTELKRWTRDVTAVVAQRVASEWRSSATNFLRFQAKLDVDSIREIAAKRSVDADPATFRPRLRFLTDTAGEEELFDEAHARRLIKDCLHNVLKKYTDVLVHSDVVVDPPSFTPAGMPPAIPDIPAIRKLPSGEKAVLSDISSTLRQRAIADLMPQPHLLAAREELSMMREHIMQFLFPDVPAGGDADSSSVFSPESAREVASPAIHPEFSDPDVDEDRSNQPAAAVSPGATPSATPPPRPTLVAAAAQPRTELEILAKTALDAALADLERSVGELVENAELDIAETIIKNDPVTSDYVKRWLRTVRSIAEPQMQQLATALTSVKVCHSTTRTVLSLRRELGGRYDAATKTSLEAALLQLHDALHVMFRHPNFARFLPIADIVAIYNHCAELMGAPAQIGQEQVDALAMKHVAGRSRSEEAASALSAAAGTTSAVSDRSSRSKRVPVPTTRPPEQ